MSPSASLFPDTKGSPDGDPPARILIAIDGAAGHDELAAMLQNCGLTVLPRGTEWREARPDVLIVQAEAPLSPPSAESLSARPGLVVLGEHTSGEADVTLPADATPRELALACRLLAQVVRLRRRLDEGSRAGDALRQQAACDPLTRLPNRRAWEEELNRQVHIARNTGQPLCVALLDLDHFKQVNDGWGHAAGDQLLAAAASALRQSLRQEDFVARLGGDEFGLLLAGLDADSAASVIERVRSRLPAQIAHTTPFVTSASVGFHVDSGGKCSAEQLLAQADLARRKAKRHGRDRTEGC
jgi:diguanylate cyclase (GGDEF)-like protein